MEYISKMTQNYTHTKVSKKKKENIERGLYFFF